MEANYSEYIICKLFSFVTNLYFNVVGEVWLG